MNFCPVKTCLVTLFDRKLNIQPNQKLGISYQFLSNLQSAYLVTLFEWSYPNDFFFYFSDDEIKFFEGHKKKPKWRGCFIVWPFQPSFPWPLVNWRKVTNVPKTVLAFLRSIWGALAFLQNGHRTFSDSHIMPSSRFCKCSIHITIKAASARLYTKRLLGSFPGLHFRDMVLKAAASRIIIPFMYS